MDDPWLPALQLDESGGRCRLTLVGVTYGNGDALQEAADDLVVRVLRLVAAIRASGLRIPGELGPPDLRVASFLYELGELAAQGEDIRDRLFGVSGPTDIAA
jgi:hypothetical protein